MGGDDGSTYKLESRVGPMDACFTGTFAWLPGEETEQIASTKFTMPTSKISLFGRVVQDKVKSGDDVKMRVYQYFFVSDECACVRTSAGGYTLLSKN